MVHDVTSRVNRRLVGPKLLCLVCVKTKNIVLARLEICVHVSLHSVVSTTNIIIVLPTISLHALQTSGVSSGFDDEGLGKMKDDGML